MIEKTIASRTMGLTNAPGTRMSGNETDSTDPGLSGENSPLSSTAERFSVAELASKSNNANLLPSAASGAMGRPGNLQGPTLENLPTSVSAAEAAADSLRRCDEGNLC